MIKTPICDLLGISTRFSRAAWPGSPTGNWRRRSRRGGGLGIIAAGNASADYVREQIHIVRGLTEKPFGVNVMLMSPSVNEVAVGAGRGTRPCHHHRRRQPGQTHEGLEDRRMQR